MEPISTATVAPALLKAAVTVASGPAKSYISRWTIRRRVASAASREARSRDIRISKRAIRNWLSRGDAQEQLRAGTAGSIASAIANLAWSIEGGQDEREHQAPEALFVILIEFIRAHDPAAASSMSAAWMSQQVTTEAEHTRGVVVAAQNAILDQLSAPQIFAGDVQHLHPWRQAAAVEIFGMWPDFANFVHTLVSASDRGAVLREWQENPPERFSSAPAEAWCWFGLSAADHTQRLTSAYLIQQGVDRGAVPRGFWLTRAAMFAHDEDPRLAETLLAGAGPTPLKEGLEALWRDEPATAVQIFSDWTPETVEDRATKASLLSQCLAAQKAVNRAIAVALLGAGDEDASGVAIIAAELLLSRARHGTSDSPLSDSNHALALSVRSRNARRQWAGDSTIPTLVAIKAAAVSGDLDRAWELAQPPPEGDATRAEADDPRIRREAAVISAMTGRLDRAQQLAQVANDPYITALVDGFVAQQDAREDLAAAAMHRAFTAAPDDAARLSVIAAMAEINCELPDLGELEAQYPEQVRELRSLHDLLPGGDETLPALRARAHESPRLVVRLAEIYSAQGDHTNAARALEDGANRWNDPQLLKMAADRYQRAGDHLAAERCAESAIALGGSGWVGEFEARVILLKAHEAQGHRESVTQQARRLVALDQNDADARWALVHCLVRAGDMQGAWSALTPNGDPVQPRDPHDARTWISLMAKYDDSEHFVRRALTTIRLWPDDEDLLGIFIAQVYSGLQREALSPTEEDLSALHQATSEYLTRFPDSSVFRAYSTGSDEDPLEAIADELRNRHEAVSDTANKVRSGAIPLGMLASASGRSYAEASIRRAAHAVLSHAPNRRDQAADEVGRALNGPVALDTTAIATLALLDKEFAAQLVGQFARLESTEAAYHDALSAQESLGLRSTLSLVWDPELSRPRPEVIPEGVADKLAVQASTVVDFLTSTHRSPWPHIKTFPNLTAMDAPWLTTLDMAVDRGIPLWCDDRILGSLAAGMGLTTFGTVDLMLELKRRDVVSHQIVEAAEAVLISNYHVDLGFSVEVMTLAATVDRWEPRGAAFALTRAFTWADPEPVARFLLTALARQLERTPDDIRDWIACAAVGLVRAHDNEADASNNLRFLFGRLVTQSWMRPDRFPAVLRGVRSGISERPGVDDPLFDVLNRQHSNLVRQHGHVVAAQLLLALVQHVEAEDRRVAVEIILRAK